MSTLALVGGQYGSEGKGVIAARLAHRSTLAVRTGGPNAGHSLNNEGRVWKMRSVPCAWVNPECKLVIGPGAVIDPEVLDREVTELEAAGFHIINRLYIDPAVTIINESDRTWEKDVLASSISSTAEGVGGARMRKIRRHRDYWVTTGDTLIVAGYKVQPTIAMINTHALAGRVLLEGTQGYGLSLHHGQWPYVTSANCTAAQLASDAGLGIHPDTSFGALVVFRSYPIRVGGPSGPLKGELTWEDISARVGTPTIEHTTVTGKVRRIAEFDWDMSKEAIMVNGAIAQALTFADYIDPAVTGETRFEYLTKPVRAFIDKMEDEHGVPVQFIGTGGPIWSLVERPNPTLHSWGSGEREDHAIAPIS